MEAGVFLGEHGELGERRLDADHGDGERFLLFGGDLAQQFGDAAGGGVEDDAEGDFLAGLPVGGSSFRGEGGGFVVDQERVIS